MQNGRADIRTSMPGTESNIIFKEPMDLGNPRIIDISQMRACDAVEAFIELLNLPEVDDTYTKLIRDLVGYRREIGRITRSEMSGR